jgi:hypothetical protein
MAGALIGWLAGQYPKNPSSASPTPPVISTSASPTAAPTLPPTQPSSPAPSPTYTHSVPPLPLPTTVATTSQPAPAPVSIATTSAPQFAVGVVDAPGHSGVEVYNEPTFRSAGLGVIYNGTRIEIFCTVAGQFAPGPYKSGTIWDRVSGGGYVPDAVIDTGTDNPVMPQCS